MEKYVIDTQAIDDIMDSLIYKFNFFNKKLTICHSYTPEGFLLSVGQALCLNECDFSEDLGKEYALEDCKTKTKDKLYDIFAYNTFYNK